MDVMDQSIRVITGSYEHNLLCVALNMTTNGPVFLPIFHFSSHSQSIRCVATAKRWLASGSNDEIIRLYDLQRRREVGALLHHSGQILCLEFFHAKWLLSGGGDGKICIWRVKDWEILGELKGHKAAVVDLAIHPSGKVALSVGEDRRLFLWNLMTGHKASVQKLAELPRKVTWVPKSNRFVIGFDRKVCWYSTATKPDAVVELNSGLQHLAYHGDDRLILGLNDGSIVVYQNGEFETTLKSHKARVKHFAFLGHDVMASVSSDGAIVVWNTKTWEERAVYDAGERLNCVCIVPDDVEKYVKENTREEDTTDNESEGEHSAAPQKKKKKARVEIIEG